MNKSPKGEERCDIVLDFWRGLYYAKDEPKKN